MEKDPLIAHLQNPTLYDHPIKYFQVIETHLSWILLTGLYAYKIKKPVQFSFVDFSTLERRKFFCEEELRLNKRLSAFLYIGLVTITGSPEYPQLNGSGKVLEYALKMEELNQDDLFTVHALENTLSSHLIEKLAIKIAHFHSKTPTLPLKTPYGNLKTIEAPLLENFKDCKTLTKNQTLLKKLKTIERFSKKLYQDSLPSFKARKKQGFIRECHGDLHLGNIVLLFNSPIIFDCIEFNNTFRCIDTMNDIAFLTMDLKHKKRDFLAFLFLNHYLSETGDYEGLQILFFYELYRAMVRAKVALLNNNKSSRQSFANYISFSENLIKKSREEKPKLIIMHGFSGSGKTTLANLLACELKGIHIRSDVERKRLFGEKAADVLYSTTATSKTYAKLLKLAKSILQAHYSVIVDATFLQKRHRQLYKMLAKQCKVPFIILQCEANKDVLKERIVARLEGNEDTSDATLSVLEQQFKANEGLGQDEIPFLLKVNTAKSVQIENLAKVIKNGLS